MEVSQSKLFTPFKIGPLSMRNRTIRAAAFEGMCPGNAPSEDAWRVFGDRRGRQDCAPARLWPGPPGR